VPLKCELSPVFIGLISESSLFSVSYSARLLVSSLSFMVRTDRRSPAGFLVRCSAQASALFVVK